MNVAKICKRCGLTFPLETEFHKDKSSKDGHCSYCKSCAKDKANDWHVNNRDRALEYSREYRLKNPDIVKAGIKQHYFANRDIYLQRVKKWSDENRERKYINNDNYEIHRRKILESIKGRYGCLFCEGLDDLEFHHIDKKTKLFNIGRNPRNFQLTVKEIRKCIILCKKHHAALSSTERATGKIYWKRYPENFNLAEYHSNLDNIIIEIQSGD